MKPIEYNHMTHREHRRHRLMLVAYGQRKPRNRKERRERFAWTIITGDYDLWVHWRYRCLP